MKDKDNVIKDNQPKKIVYSDAKYPDNHWAMVPPDPKDPFFIALLKVETGVNKLSHEYLIKINPTDARGLRLIIKKVNRKNMSSGFNRNFTLSENIGLGIVIGAMKSTIEKLGLTCQAEKAGNNAHVFKEETGTTICGTDKEPLELHAHIIMRSTKNSNILGVDINSPEPGNIFNMRGTGQGYNNTNKIKWHPMVANIISSHLMKKLSKVVARNPDIAILQAKTLKNKINYKYGPNDYDSDNHDVKIPSSEDDNFIAILNIDGINVALVLNSADARGYRAKAKLIDQEDMRATFNRDYTLKENIAVNKASAILAQIYSEINTQSQTAIAGNASHTVDKNGTLQLGTKDKPNMLFVHVYGRGDPKHCYIDGVPLRGPNPGELFDRLGIAGKNKGNGQNKEPWRPGEMQIVKEKMAKILRFILNTSPIQGVSIIETKIKAQKKRVITV